MKELVYKHEVRVFSEAGKEIYSTILDYFTFPSDEEIMRITEENGGAYSKVDRIYVPDVIPFS